MTVGQWFSFEGRIGRKIWWLGYVLPLIVAISSLGTALDVGLGFMSVVQVPTVDGFSPSDAGDRGVQPAGAGAADLGSG